MAPLKSNGLVDCHNYGLFGNAKNVGIKEPLSSKMANLQIEYEKILRRKPRDDKIHILNHAMLYRRRKMVSLRTLAPSLTRITIAAAVGAALHIGQGNAKIVDQRAVDFSRALLAQTEIDGEVISCEGPKDNAPAFSRREKVGIGK